MRDSFGRDITYLRVSVTDRCNLRCVYCMPAEGVRLLGHGEILSYEQIAQVVVAAARLGIRGIGIDLDPAYCAAAKKRLANRLPDDPRL